MFRENPFLLPKVSRIYLLFHVLSNSPRNQIIIKDWPCPRWWVIHPRTQIFRPEAFVARLASIGPPRRACWVRGGAWQVYLQSCIWLCRRPSFRAYLGRTDSVPRLQSVIRREVRKGKNLARASVRQLEPHFGFCGNASLIATSEVRKQTVKDR